MYFKNHNNYYIFFLQICLGTSYQICQVIYWLHILIWFTWISQETDLRKLGNFFYIFFYLSIYFLSIHVFLNLSTFFLSIYFSTYSHIFLSIHIFFYLSIYFLSLRIFFYLSIYYLSIHILIYLSMFFLSVKKFGTTSYIRCQV